MPQINIENPCITHRCSACCEAGTLIRLTQEEMHFLRQFGTQLIRHYEVLGGWASEPLW